MKMERERKSKVQLSVRIDMDQDLFLWRKAHRDRSSVSCVVRQAIDFLQKTDDEETNTA